MTLNLNFRQTILVTTVTTGGYFHLLTIKFHDHEVVSSELKTDFSLMSVTIAAPVSLCLTGFHSVFEHFAIRGNTGFLYIFDQWMFSVSGDF